MMYTKRREKGGRERERDREGVDAVTYSQIAELIGIKVYW